jgi:hypothetical protein
MAALDVAALVRLLQEADPAALAQLQQRQEPVGVGPPLEPILAAVPAPLAPRRVTFPTTISDKYGRAESDRLIGHYAAVYAPFQVLGHAGAPALLQEVSRSVPEDERLAFLICTLDPDQGRVMVPLWGPAVHQDPIRARTPRHNKVVGFRRDVVRGELPASVELEASWLYPELAIEVPSLANFEEALAQAPAGDDRITLDLTEDTDDVSVPQMVPLPLCLLPLLLLNPLTPLQAWPLLRAAAREAGILADCSLLWDFLRASASDLEGETLVPPLVLVDGDDAFVMGRRRLLDALLPAPLAPTALPPTAAPPRALLPSNGADEIARAISAATRREAPVGVEDKWPHTYHRLLRLTGRNAVAELPSFWGQFANQKKAHRVNFLRSACAAMADSLELSCPPSTAATVETLESLDLVGGSADSLETGLTIWQFPALAPAESDSLAANMRAWETLLTGGTSVPLAELKQLLKTVKVQAPTRWLHATVQIENWTVVMALLLGESHAAVAWLVALCREARLNGLEYDRQTEQRSTLPVDVLRRLQLTFHTFFRSVAARGPTVEPEISSILRELQEQRLHSPALPSVLRSLLGLNTPQRSPGAGGRALGGAPAPTPAPRAPGGGGRGSPDPNRNFLEQLSIPAGRNLRECIGRCTREGGQLPLTDDGEEFCLAFQYVGRCDTSCRGCLRGTHRAPSARELPRLLAWRRRWVPGAPAEEEPPAPRPPPARPVGNRPPRPVPSAPAPAPAPPPPEAS